MAGCSIWMENHKGLYVPLFDPILIISKLPFGSKLKEDSDNALTIRYSTLQGQLCWQYRALGMKHFREKPRSLKVRLELQSHWNINVCDLSCMAASLVFHFNDITLMWERYESHIYKSFSFLILQKQNVPFMSWNTFWNWLYLIHFGWVNLSRWDIRKWN